MSKGLSRILKPATAGAVLTVLVAGAAVLTQSSETLLRSSFERALTPPSVTTTTTTAQVQRELPVSGSEEFWLTAMGREPAASKGISLGDRITLTLDGKERNYRVTSVSDIAPATTHIDTRARADRLVLVTAKDTADALSRPVRFVLELPAAEAGGASAGRPARAS